MIRKRHLAFGLFSLLSTGLYAAPTNDLQTEEVSLSNGTKLTIIQQNDRILGIIGNGKERFVTEERLAEKTAHKPFELQTRQGHYPERLEKAPPLPDSVPEEVRRQLRSWRILDDSGQVMDIIFCTDQGCSIGGYTYTAQQP
jgi:hypothetical protein